MDSNQVLIRTAKGQEEILTKASNLSHCERRVLIEVDEQSTVGDTLHRLAPLGDEARTALDNLLVQGFVALGHMPAETAAYSFEEWETLSEEYETPDDAAPAGMAVHRHAPFNLEKAKGFARFVILGALGPAGSRRIERLDAAKDVHELRAELDDLRDLLNKILSKRQAQHVWEQLQPLMMSVR